VKVKEFKRNYKWRAPKAITATARKLACIFYRDIPEHSASATAILN
jgi:hypothetical protein